MTQAGDKRLYILKFQQGDRKMFFWFQEEDASRDEEFVRKVNQNLNGEEAPGADAGAANPGPSEEPRGDSSGGAQPPPEGKKDGSDGSDEATPSDRKDNDAVPMDTAEQEEGGNAGTQQDELTTHPITESDLGMMAAAGVSQADLAAALLAATATSVQGSTGPSLSEVLKPDTIIPLLRNKEIQERLAEYLPEEHRHEQAILELASSPQFQQQLETFSEALQSGQLNLNAFGIPHNALTVADFLKSIESISSQEDKTTDNEEKSGAKGH